MGSNRARSEAFGAYREIFEHFQKRKTEAMLGVSSQEQVDLRKPLIWERFEILMAPLVEKRDDVQEELDEIDEAEEYVERAKERVHRRDQNPRRIARRLRRTDKMKVLMRLAHKEGLIGKEHEPPADASEVLGDEAIGIDELDQDEPGSDRADRDGSGGDGDRFEAPEAESS